jgi:uncharacterized protein YegL
MKTRKTIYHLIVDKSGSMSDCVETTINGFNEQVKRIKMNQLEFKEEEITIGLSTFNNKVNHHYFEANPKSIEPLNDRMYKPDGSTALYDAIGKSISIIEEKIKSDIAATVVVVIITDGYENASILFTLAKVKAMISRLEETRKWTFSFIGATLDAVDVAESLSIKKQNSFAFDKGDMDKQVWSKLNDSMGSYFSKKQANQSTDYLFED